VKPEAQEEGISERNI